MKENHKCLSVVDRASDYICGVNSPISPITWNSSGDWEPYLPDFDPQKDRGIETDACVPFTATESVEMQINFLMKTGQVPYEYTKALDALGFLDERGNFEASERFVAKMDGTSDQGTSLPAPWDAMRKFRMLPYKDWPFDQRVKNFSDFYETIPQVLLDKAKEFLKYFEVSYEWIDYASSRHPIDQLKTHLAHAPICIGTPACKPWNQAQPPVCTSNSPDHSTCVYRVDSAVRILDHYAPFKKSLSISYNIPYALMGVVKIKPIPFAPIPETVAPTVENRDILSRLVTLYENLVALWKGRNNL